MKCSGRSRTAPTSSSRIITGKALFDMDNEEDEALVKALRLDPAEIECGAMLDRLEAWRANWGVKSSDLLQMAKDIHASRLRSGSA